MAVVRGVALQQLGGEAGINFSLLLNHSRVALGAGAVGVARAGFEYARDYAKHRGEHSMIPAAIFCIAEVRIRLVAGVHP